MYVDPIGPVALSVDPSAEASVAKVKVAEPIISFREPQEPGAVYRGVKAADDPYSIEAEVRASHHREHQEQGQGKHRWEQEQVGLSKRWKHYIEQVGTLLCISYIG